MRGGPNLKTRSDLETTDEELHGDDRKNAEYVCFHLFCSKGNKKTMSVLKLELPPRGIQPTQGGVSGCNPVKTCPNEAEFFAVGSPRKAYIGSQSKLRTKYCSYGWRLGI